MKKLVIGAALIMASSASWAEGVTPASLATGTPGAYGSAGCGLGSLLLGDKREMQVFAMTTNGSSSSQSFGITFGTSNCKAMFVSVQFIENNMHALKMDAAQGQGETLNSLASLYSVENTVAFNSALKANYADIFSSSDAEVIEAKIQAVAQQINA